MPLITPIKLSIAEKLEKDEGFRNRFFRGQVQDIIAMSIRGLREKRKLRQSDLANKSGMKQSAISRVEQAEYSSWSFTTLFRVAEALGARLRVTIEPVEDVIAQYKRREDTDIESVKLVRNIAEISGMEIELNIPSKTPLPVRMDLSSTTGASTIRMMSGSNG
jgi:transcriptional regulator with XRE-family HTH domain